MSNITGDVIDVLVKLGLVESNGGGGVTPGLRKITDANGNKVLAVGSTEYILTENHIIAGGGDTVACANYAKPSLDISSVTLDTHNLADLANNVILNPFYGVRDCYLSGSMNVKWEFDTTAAPASGHQRAAGVSTTTTLGGAKTEIALLRFPAVASFIVGQMITPNLCALVVPSTAQYITLDAYQEGIATLKASVEFEINIF